MNFKVTLVASKGFLILITMDVFPLIMYRVFAIKVYSSAVDVGNENDSVLYTFLLFWPVSMGR